MNIPFEGFSCEEFSETVSTDDFRSAWAKFVAEQWRSFVNGMDPEDAIDQVDTDDYEELFVAILDEDCMDEYERQQECVGSSNRASPYSIMSKVRELVSDDFDRLRRSFVEERLEWLEGKIPSTEEMDEAIEDEQKRLSIIHRVSDVFSSWESDVKDYKYMEMFPEFVRRIALAFSEALRHPMFRLGDLLRLYEDSGIGLAEVFCYGGIMGNPVLAIWVFESEDVILSYIPNLMTRICNNAQRIFGLSEYADIPDDLLKQAIDRGVKISMRSNFYHLKYLAQQNFGEGQFQKAAVTANAIGKMLRAALEYYDKEEWLPLVPVPFEFLFDEPDSP